MKMLRAIGFAISYPVTRVGGVLLLRLANSLKNHSRHRSDRRR